MIKKIEEFLNSPDIKGLAESTRQSYHHALVSNYYTFHTRDCSHPLERIQKEEVLGEFVDWLQRKGTSGTTIQQYLTIVKLFYKWCGIPVEYTYRIPRDERQGNAVKRMERWFDERDIEFCLHYKHGMRNEIIVRLLIETGIRVQELADIKSEDIIIQERTIWIQKSKTKPRPVFFSAYTYDRLMEYLKTARRVDLFLVDSGARVLFPSAGQIKTIVRNILEDLNLKTPKDGRGPHTFRHWCATYLFYVGDMRLQDIARLLGDTPDVIEKTYLHPTPAMLRSRIDKAMGW